jgi:hypothetical protein
MVGLVERWGELDDTSEPEPDGDAKVGPDGVTK